MATPKIEHDSPSSPNPKIITTHPCNDDDQHSLNSEVVAFLCAEIGSPWAETLGVRRDRILDSGFFLFLAVKS